MNTDTVFLPGDIVELTAPCSIEVEGECECCGNPKTFDIDLDEGRRFEVVKDRGRSYVTVWFVSKDYDRQMVILDALFLELVRRPNNFPRHYKTDLFTLAGVAV